MSFETVCEIRLIKDGEVIIDPLRGLLMKMVDETGSIDRAAGQIGVSKETARDWLDIMRQAIGAEVISHSAAGKAGLTVEGRSLLEDFETRSRIAGGQVQNLWKKPWVTTDGIVVVKDQVVLIKRGREPFKGMYALPGGIVEYGESVEECVVREIEEETGLKTKVLDLVGVYSKADRDPRGHFITLAFNLQHVGGSLHGGDDAAEAALFPLEDLPELAADHLMILSEALLKRDRYRSKTGQRRSSEGTTHRKKE